MKRWLIWLILTALVLPAGLFLRTFQASPLPAPPPFQGTLRPASPPPGMAVFQLPTGITRRSAGAAYRGGSFRDRRDFAMTAVLVRHPDGDLLIDTGFGRRIEEQFRDMPRAFRLLTTYERTRSAAEQLAMAGYDPGRLRAIVLTHAHWDHVSGIPDFPGTPVWITPEERRFIAEGGMTTTVARGLSDVHYEEYSFDGGEYLGFARSHDVYGDGAIVIVPAPGHTPGSVIVFLTLPSGKRFAMVGDLAWQREGITLREEKPWIVRTGVDHDPQGVRENLVRMNAIATRFPDLTLVPAHDARGFAGMPRL